tara:strand:- start:253 stop:1524 length:1272 start_codon:yes stop_codon:yes gene_type:complete
LFNKNPAREKNEPSRSVFSILGPGILYAASAVGVSHLIQGTRAGADYGLQLSLIIIITCIFKYPCIRFGGDYAAATGQSLISNYRSQGWWAFGIYSVAQIISMVFVIAAISLFTQGLLQVALDFEMHPILGVSLLLGIVAIILLTGHYRLLETISKFIVAIFSILILLAVVLVAGKIEWSFSNVLLPPINVPMLLYMVAMIGFMPTPTDASVVQSLWTCARAEEKGQLPSPSDAILDFNVGYIMSVVLALCFLVLGAGVMHVPGTELETSSVGFSRQLIELFTETIGSWSFPLISIAIIFVMLSTLIAVVDGMTRVAVGITESVSRKPSEKRYNIYLGVLTLLAILTLATMLKSFTIFINITSVIVFVVSPILAFLNHRAMWSDRVPKDLQPSILLKYWSITGIVFLSLVTLTYFYVLLFTVS